MIMNFKVLFKNTGHDHQVNVDTLCTIYNVDVSPFKLSVLILLRLLIESSVCGLSSTVHSQ